MRTKFKRHKSKIVINVYKNEEGNDMNKFRIILVAFMLAFIMTGCSSQSSSEQAKVTDTQAIAQTIEQLTTPINQVASRYGETNPQIVKSNKGMSDGPTQKLMYSVFLDGNFIKGNLKASNLEFSILSDGSRVWAIRAFNDNKDVWLDNE